QIEFLLQRKSDSTILREKPNRRAAIAAQDAGDCRPLADIVPALLLSVFLIPYNSTQALFLLARVTPLTLHSPQPIILAVTAHIHEQQSYVQYPHHYARWTKIILQIEMAEH